MDSRDRVFEAVRSVLNAEPGLRFGYVFGSLARGRPFP